jgi:hypothetical protein
VIAPANPSSDVASWSSCFRTTVPAHGLPVPPTTSPTSPTSPLSTKLRKSPVHLHFFSAPHTSAFVFNSCTLTRDGQEFESPGLCRGHILTSHKSFIKVITPYFRPLRVIQYDCMRSPTSGTPISGTQYVPRSPLYVSPELRNSGTPNSGSLVCSFMLLSSFILVYLIS